ncbi:MAG: NAD(P)/FAD-dependent oxidoreductase [Pseudomonadota bacterium]
MSARVVVVGAGPVGTLLAIMLARLGMQVDLLEARTDSRIHDVYEGRSINIALSERGWLALSRIGADEAVRAVSLPMSARAMHDRDGAVTRQPYGQPGQAIWSVSRAAVNEVLLNMADQEPNITLHFEAVLAAIDLPSRRAFFTRPEHSDLELSFDYLFGADGANSKVRRLLAVDHGAEVNVRRMGHSYLELNMPPAIDGSHALAKDALHIWPRGNYMLIALPNPDGSMTATAFLPDEGANSFASLSERRAVEAMFDQDFADARPLLERPVQRFLQTRPSLLALAEVSRWVFAGRVALIGDSAHAIVPFYGQGLNCGFEDCRAFGDLFADYEGDWARTLAAYETVRKPNADALSELAMQNFTEMSELSGRPEFLLQKTIERDFHLAHPELWVPLYTQVTFLPEVSYSDALAAGVRQQKIMDQVMALPWVADADRSAEVQQFLLDLVTNHHHDRKQPPPARLGEER